MPLPIVATIVAAVGRLSLSTDYRSLFTDGPPPPMDIIATLHVVYGRISFQELPIGKLDTDLAFAHARFDRQ